MSQKGNTMQVLTSVDDMKRELLEVLGHTDANGSPVYAIQFSYGETCLAKYDRRSADRGLFVPLPGIPYYDEKALTKAARELESQGKIISYSYHKQIERGMTLSYIVGLPQFEKLFEPEGRVLVAA
jgi:hypothetical protein